MKFFAEINNKDNSVIRELRANDDWKAPAHKFGPDKPTQFLEVKNENLDYDSLLFDTESKTKIENGFYVKYYTLKRKEKSVLIDIIKNLATEKINSKISAEDKINMLAAAIEFEKNNRVKKPLSQSELDADTQRQKFWDWVKQVRLFAQNLIVNVDSLMDLRNQSWPDISA